MRVTSKAISILLVDDHPVMRAGVRALLLAEGMAVVGEANDGERAVQLTRKLKPDVVLMDVALPKLSGAEATKQIVTSTPDAKVLVLSAHHEVAFVNLLLAAGARGYALKRSVVEQLPRALRVVAAGDTYVDPSLVGDLNAQRPPRRRSPGGVPVVTLSEREAQVLQLTARGHTAREMAESLEVSTRTLETYKERAMSKLSLRSRAELMRYALRSGWLRDV